MQGTQKWEKLRNYLIESLEGAEAGEHQEAESMIRATLNQMEELDNK